MQDNKKQDAYIPSERQLEVTQRLAGVFQHPWAGLPAPETQSKTLGEIRAATWRFVADGMFIGAAHEECAPTEGPIATQLVHIQVMGNLTLFWTVRADGHLTLEVNGHADSDVREIWVRELRCERISGTQFFAKIMAGTPMVEINLAPGSAPIRSSLRIDPELRVLGPRCTSQALNLALTAVVAVHSLYAEVGTQMMEDVNQAMFWKDVYEHDAEELERLRANQAVPAQQDEFGTQPN